MPVKKKLLIFTIVVSSLIIISLIIVFIAFNLLKISYNNNEKSSVEGQITITRDSNGIPAIEAESTNDFYFALGYLHAQDRLNIIEYLRSIANSESDNFAGSDTSLLNNLCTTAGFTKNAEDIAAKLKEEEISALQSYVNGINHIRSKNHVRNLTSREWIIDDVLAILSMKEWANSYLNNKELIFNLSDSNIQNTKNMFRDNRYLYFYSDDDLKYLYTLRRIKEIIDKYICTFARGNSIYISPSNSSTGTESFTTLNYEDSFNTYPGWYPVKLKIKGASTLAVTYNGLPFIMSYKNSSMSLTQVNINADSQNFYLFETDKKNDTLQYKSAGSWKDYLSVRIPSYTRNEKSYQIKWTTEKGPVFSELISTAKTDSRILVIDSPLPGVEYIRIMLNIPFETDIEKIRQSVMTNDSSLKSFIVSDNKKAYKIYTGFINQTDNYNRIFIDGSRSLKSPTSKIQIVKQIAGIEYAGSDLTTIKDIPNSYKNTITNDYKNERFNSLLLNKNIYDSDKVIKIISDTQSPAAEKFTPIFTSIIQSNPLTSAKLSKIYLNDWDYSAKAGLQSSSIFYTTLAFYITESYKDDFEKDADYNLNSAYLLYPDFYDQCQKRLPSIFDKPETINTETRETVFDIAFLNAMRFLNRKEGPLMENWKWGLITKSSYKIPNERLNFFSRFFKIEKQPLSGGPDTIENVLQNGKFTTTSATSFQSYMHNETMQIKMNFGYSTSMLSDFYYGKTMIENFQDMNNSSQIYKTTISNK